MTFPVASTLTIAMQFPINVIFPIVSRNQTACEIALFSRNIFGRYDLRRLIWAERVTMFDTKDDSIDPATSFELKWQGSCIVVIPAASVETMRWDLIEPAAAIGGVAVVWLVRHT